MSRSMVNGSTNNRLPLPEAGNKSLYFLPVIVLRESHEMTLNSDEHNVSPIVAWPHGTFSKRRRPGRRDSL